MNYNRALIKFYNLGPLFPSNNTGRFFQRGFKFFIMTQSDSLKRSNLGQPVIESLGQPVIESLSQLMRLILRNILHAHTKFSSNNLKTIYILYTILTFTTKNKDKRYQKHDVALVLWMLEKSFMDFCQFP